MYIIEKTTTKTLLISILVMSSSFVRAQVFDGVDINGPREVFIANMEDRGYKLKKQTDVLTFFYGNHKNPDFEIVAVSTPKSKLICKLTVVTATQSSWYFLHDSFEEYVKILTERYGEATNKYKFFDLPYGNGDANELNGVVEGKCHFLFIWNSSKANIAVNISTHKNVWITYENQTNLKIFDQEKSEVDKTTF